MPRPKQESVAPEDQDAPGIIEDPKLTFGNCDLEYVPLSFLLPRLANST